jgi:hypothetical protein
MSNEVCHSVVQGYPDFNKSNTFVIAWMPVETGIQPINPLMDCKLDSRLRGNDTWFGWLDGAGHCISRTLSTP